MDFIGVATGGVSKEKFKNEGARSVSAFTDLLKILSVPSPSF
jgi:hypothetical protein